MTAADDVYIKCPRSLQALTIHQSSGTLDSNYTECVETKGRD